MKTINVAYMILFANLQRFFLLKEFVMAKITDRASKVVASHAWPRVKESNSMLAEIVETFLQRIQPAIEKLRRNNVCVNTSKEAGGYLR